MSKRVAAAALDHRRLDSDGVAEDPMEAQRRWLLNAGRPSSWSSKALDELGIDVSEYCTEGDATASVSLPKQAVRR